MNVEQLLKRMPWYSEAHMDEARAHDADDARRDAALRQAREALKAEHGAACEVWDGPCTKENCQIAAALAAIDAVEVRAE